MHFRSVKIGIFFTNRDAPLRCTATDCLVGLTIHHRDQLIYDWFTILCLIGIQVAMGTILFVQVPHYRLLGCDIIAPAGFHTIVPTDTIYR